ncbi:MAG: hypothetical protein J4F36_14670 [Nitrosopumilaceae archaeon]|nr:hypothetical protein [Nitrosopumilaceae archaeon]
MQQLKKKNTGVTTTGYATEEYVDHQTSNLRTYIDSKNYASEDYVDTNINLLTAATTYIDDKFKNDLNMNINKIINVATPISDTDAVNKRYVDSRISPLNLPVTDGISMAYITDPNYCTIGADARVAALRDPFKWSNQL